MRHVRLSIFLSAIPLAVCLILAGCGGTHIKHLNAKEFIARGAPERRGSADWTTYIGSTSSRVYLEYGTVVTLFSHLRTVVYWTELKNLPPDIAKRIRSGQNPWKRPGEQ
jgi:hypothetical protein